MAESSQATVWGTPINRSEKKPAVGRRCPAGAGAPPVSLLQSANLRGFFTVPWRIPGGYARRHNGDSILRRRSTLAEGRGSDDGLSVFVRSEDVSIGKRLRNGSNEAARGITETGLAHGSFLPPRWRSVSSEEPQPCPSSNPGPARRRFGTPAPPSRTWASIATASGKPIRRCAVRPKRLRSARG